MTYLAERLFLSADPFSYVTHARESQTQWVAYLAAMLARKHNLPLVLLGRAYKPGVDIETGSAGLLLGSMFGRFPYKWDDKSEPAVYVACLPGTTKDIPDGSIVLDPWGTTRDKDGIEVIRIGRQR